MKASSRKAMWINLLPKRPRPQARASDKQRLLVTPPLRLCLSTQAIMGLVQYWVTGLVRRPGTEVVVVVSMTTG